MDQKNIKKKIKVKNKSIIFILLFLIIVVLSFLAGYFLLGNFQKDSLEQIEKNYATSVITVRDAKLYNKKKKVVGKIQKGFSLELEEIKKLSLETNYFKIKDTSYYVSYKDVKKSKKIESSSLSSMYLPFNKNIQGKNISFYHNKKNVLTIDEEINLPILSSNQDSYTVSFLNRLLEVKKNKNIKEIDSKNTEETEASSVSVLYYEGIAPICTDDNCVPSSLVRDQIDRLKEEGYSFLTKEEYMNYVNGYVRLKNKVVLLSTKEETDEVKKIMDEYQIPVAIFNDSDHISFQSSNKTSTPQDEKTAVNRYQLKRYSTASNIVKMANGEEVIESASSTSSSINGVPVLNYHFFYDPGNGESCDESICLTTAKFREHLEYLKNNGYTALTMKEFVSWIYGEIDVPEKSVLITIDDGAMGTGAHNGNKLIPLLEEYKMHATLFLIAGWWKIDNYQSDYLEIQSHTYNMHQYGSCGKGELVCANYEEAKADLSLSLQEIKDNTSFCYPFYNYDDEAVQAVKDLGFRVAFAGGNRNATRNSNKYAVPRYPILSSITLNQFINIVN